MTKQHEHVIVFKKYDKWLLLHLFFVIYDQITSNLQALSHYVLSHIQIPLKEFLRDCRSTNNFCNAQRILSVKKIPPPQLTPLFLTDSIKMDRIPTKIKCKIHAPFILTNFYKTQLARYLVLIQTIQFVTKVYLQIADKNLTTMVFQILFHEARAWAVWLS